MLLAISSAYLAFELARSMRSTAGAAAQMQKRVDRLMDAAELREREREFPEG